MKANNIGPWSNDPKRPARKEEIARIKESLRIERELRPDGPVTDPKLKAAIKEKRRLNRERRNG